LVAMEWSGVEWKGLEWVWGSWSRYCEHEPERDLCGNGNGSGSGSGKGSGWGREVMPRQVAPGL
jgi:hypothetical protein